MEGRVFTPEDIIATITLEDVEVPSEAGCLNIHDVLSAVHYKTFQLVCLDDQPAALAERAEGETKQDWYEGRDDGEEGDEDGDDEDSDESTNQTSGTEGATEGGSSIGGLAAEGLVEPIKDLPKTVLQQLEAKSIKTLADASEFLVENGGDQSKLGISQQAVKRLIAQLVAANLPIGPVE